MQLWIKIKKLAGYTESICFERSTLSSCSMMPTNEEPINCYYTTKKLSVTNNRFSPARGDKTGRCCYCRVVKRNERIVWCTQRATSEGNTRSKSSN